MADRQCYACADDGCERCSEWCPACRRWIFMGLSNPGHDCPKPKQRDGSSEAGEQRG